MAVPLKTVATRHQVHLERLKSGYQDDFTKFLKQMDRDIRLKLAGEDLTAYSLTRLNTLLGAVRRTLSSVYKDYGQVYFTTMQDVAEYEAEFEANAVKQATKARMILPSPAQMRAAVLTHPLSVEGPDKGSLLEPMFSRWSNKTILRIDGAIRLGYAQGETTGQILRRIRGTREASFKDGLLAVAERDAQAMVRTGLQHVAAQAREELYRENTDIITGIEWVSTLDNRTTIQCQSLDGQVFPVDKGPRPPIHINCRSTTIPVLDPKFAPKDMPEPKRAAKGADGAGPVKNQTYYEWLKTQPKEFQESALGVARTQLLRDGELSTERFAELQLGKNFAPLTLVQMRKLEPIAFIRAGLN